MGNRKRNRNKSSPGQDNSIKKHKPLRFLNIETTPEKESGLSEFFEVEKQPDILVSPPTSQTKMSKFSQADIKELSSQLAPVLIKELKVQLQEEIIKELRGEFINIIQEETKMLKDEVSALRAEVASLKSDLKSSEMDQDELAQYGRRMNLDISGIPGDTGSSEENVESKILAEAKKRGIQLSSSDIDKCHRKGKPKDNYNRKVIVKFTNSKARQRVYNARKEMSHGIFVQENLTPLRENLSFQARQLKRDKLITKTWIAGCRVYVQVTGATKSCLIKHMDDIQEIRNKL
jgi:hypothetical protein